MTQAESTDLLIIGSGIAGLTVALEAADHADVLILTKADPWDSATSRAQGGVAAAVGPDDSPERHLQDTMDAGAGLCDRAAVEVCVQEGPASIRWVEELGVSFCRDANGTRDLGQEGGHRRRRWGTTGTPAPPRSRAPPCSPGTPAPWRDWSRGCRLPLER